MKKGKKIDRRREIRLYVYTCTRREHGEINVQQREYSFLRMKRKKLHINIILLFTFAVAADAVVFATAATAAVAPTCDMEWSCFCSYLNRNVDAQRHFVCVNGIFSVLFLMSLYKCNCLCIHTLFFLDFTHTFRSFFFFLFFTFQLFLLNVNKKKK